VRTIFVNDLAKVLAEHCGYDRATIHSIEVNVGGVPREIPIGKGGRLTINYASYDDTEKGRAVTAPAH
jgi:hypothetical protein